jgi:hypothetical protein
MHDERVGFARMPQVQGPMQVIALIDDPGVVRRILEHPGALDKRNMHEYSTGKSPAAVMPSSFTACMVTRRTARMTSCASS